MIDLEFEEDLRLQNLSERTIKEYLHVLKKLPAQKKAQKTYLSKHTDNSMLIRAYRKYLKFQRKQGVISGEELLDQLDTFRLPKHRGTSQNGKWLPFEQWEELVANGSSRSAKMAIWLGLQFGLRLGEIINLRVNDIDLTNNKVLIQQHKKDDKKEQVYWHPKHFRDRFIPMTPEQHEVLERWISERPPLTHPYLVYSVHNKQVTERTLQRWVSKASNKTLKTHDLRRSYAKVLYFKSKKNLKLVQITLGHSNISTTSTYLGLEEEEIQQEFVKAMG